MVNFSDYNKKILFGYANELGAKINNLAPKAAAEPNFSLWEKISSLFPGAKSTGQTVGYLAATAHGPGLSNQTINFVCRRIFASETTHTFGGWFKSAILGIAQPTVAEAAKLTITPKMLPVLQYLGIAVGGLTASGAVALATILYGRVFNQENCRFTLNNPPPIEELLKADKSGKIFDANGCELTKRDLEDIRKCVLTYNTATKFIDADKSSLDQLLDQFLLVRSDVNRLFYQDGTRVSEEDLNIIEKAYERLKGINPMEKAGKIHEMIKLLTKHNAKETEYLTCEDGVICKRDGTPISQAEIDAKSAERGREIEQAVKAFEIIPR